MHARAHRRFSSLTNRSYFGEFRGRYVPAGQSWQVNCEVAFSVSEYLPTKHVWQLSVPVLLLYLPGTHPVQPDPSPLGVYPGPQSCDNALVHQDSRAMHASVLLPARIPPAPIAPPGATRQQRFCDRSISATVTAPAVRIFMVVHHAHHREQPIPHTSVQHHIATHTNTIAARTHAKLLPETSSQVLPSGLPDTPADDSDHIKCVQEHPAAEADEKRGGPRAGFLKWVCWLAMHVPEHGLAACIRDGDAKQTTHKHTLGVRHRQDQRPGEIFFLLAVACGDTHPNDCERVCSFTVVAD